MLWEGRRGRIQKIFLESKVSIKIRGFNTSFFYLKKFLLTSNKKSSILSLKSELKEVDI